MADDRVEPEATVRLREFLTGTREPITKPTNIEERRQLEELDKPSISEPAPTVPAVEPTSKMDHISHVNTAVSSLEQALTSVGSHSQAGRAILDALRTLSKHFGETGKPAPAVTPDLRNLMMGGQK